jgi:hypothetical protein
MGSVKTAVIDDGVNEKLYNTGMLQHNIEITPKLEIRQRFGYDPFLPSHGTILQGNRCADRNYS